MKVSMAAGMVPVIVALAAVVHGMTIAPGDVAETDTRPVFSGADRDGNERLDPAEVLGLGIGGERWRVFDFDGDGTLSRSEFDKLFGDVTPAG